MKLNRKYIIGILIVLGLFMTVAGLAQVGASVYADSSDFVLMMRSGHIEDGDYVCYDLPGNKEIHTTELTVNGITYQAKYYQAGSMGKIVSLNPIEPEEESGGEEHEQPVYTNITNDTTPSDVDPDQPETMTTPGSIYDVGGVYLQLAQGSLESGKYTYYEDDGSYDTLVKTSFVMGKMYQFKYAITEYGIGKIVDILNDDDSGRPQPIPIEKYGQSYSLSGHQAWLQSGSIESNEFTLFENDGLDTITSMAFVMGKIYSFDYTVDQYGVAKIVGISPDNRVVEEPEPVVNNTTDDTNTSDVEPETVGKIYTYTGGLCQLWAGSFEEGNYICYPEDLSQPFNIGAVVCDGHQYIVKVMYTEPGSIGRICAVLNEVNNTTDVEPQVNNTTDVEPQVNNTTDVEPEESILGKSYDTPYGEAYLKDGALEIGKYMVFEDNEDARHEWWYVTDDFGNSFFVSFWIGEDGKCRITYAEPYTVPIEENNTTDVEPTNITNDTEGKGDVDPVIVNPEDPTGGDPCDNPGEDPAADDPLQPPLVPEDEPYSDPDRREQSVCPVIDGGANATADVDEAVSTNQNSTPAPDNNKIVMQKTGNGIILAILAVIAILGAVVYIRR